MPEKYQDVMRKAVYDTNDDGVVDAAATAAAVTGVSPLTGVTTPVGAVLSVFPGQQYINTSTGTVYVSTQAASNAHWEVIT